MIRKTLKVGDIFEIPLSDGRKACGQYVRADKDNGPVIRIFDLITKDDMKIDEIVNAPVMFPPIVVGLKAAIKSGLWTIIGNLPVTDFVPPNFISAMYNSISDKVGMWYLWDGIESKFIPIGNKLPEEYRGLEQLVVWAAEDVTKRIETGVNPLDRRLDL
ncbi:MAG: immunity 26/phosphotriesterase HocA family protein [Anaerolineae bacterium]|nr:immunity 26/phosphotriesterase HocA family protein [Anaerolineae bacterium]